MSIETIEVLDGGLLTTIQDRGRYGFQRFGVPVSGAMDMFALRAANILVGNAESAAGLEMTVLGPRIRFLADTSIALTGADLSALLDGEPLESWKQVRVSQDNELCFTGAKDGMRSYLAIAGGIDVPPVMGSRSTYLKSGIGGLHGRALKAGDVLNALPTETDTILTERALLLDMKVPQYGHEHEIRVVLGPQESAFSSDGIATFLGSKYTVSIQSDRMGYRLDGPAIEHSASPDIVSDGTPLGAVQIPGDGHPIILLADRGPTGGYTKIATVITTDVSKLGQAMPGDTLAFKAINGEEAHTILREEETLLSNINMAGKTDNTSRLNIVVDGQGFGFVDGSDDLVELSKSATVEGPSETHRANAIIHGRTYEFEVNIHRRE